MVHGAVNNNGDLVETPRWGVSRRAHRQSLVTSAWTTEVAMRSSHVSWEKSGGMAPIAVLQNNRLQVFRSSEQGRFRKVYDER